LKIGKELEAIDFRARSHELIDGASEVEDDHELRVGRRRCVSQLRALTRKSFVQHLELGCQSLALSRWRWLLDRAKRRRSIARRDRASGWRTEGEKGSGISYRCACVRHCSIRVCAIARRLASGNPST